MDEGGRKQENTSVSSMKTVGFHLRSFCRILGLPGNAFHRKKSNLVDKSRLELNQEPCCELTRRCNLQSLRCTNERNFCCTDLLKTHIILSCWLARAPMSKRRINEINPSHWYYSFHFSFDLDHSGCFVPSILVQGAPCVCTGCNDMQYLMAPDSFLKCDTFPLLPRLDSRSL